MGVKCRIGEAGRSAERKSGHHLKDCDADGSNRCESNIPGSYRLSRSFGFHTLTPAVRQTAPTFTIRAEVPQEKREEDKCC